MKTSEHMIEVTVKKKPMANILTRGTGSARMVAHNLPFDHRMVNATADHFTMLYAKGGEFWSITVTKGEKATLKLLTTDQAEKLFTGLPKKLYSHTFLFDPERHKRQVQADRTANSELKEQERQEIEQAEWEALGPLGRFDKSPPLKGWG